MKGPQQSTQLAAGRLTRLAGLPIPLLLAAMGLLWMADLRTACESEALLTVFNFLFSTVASLLVAILIGRSYLARGSPGLLFLGCGVTVWGAAGTLVPVLFPYGTNVLIGGHNSLVWFAALCHLTGVMLSVRPWRAPRLAGLTLAIAYAGAACLVWLVTMMAVEGWMPVFFVQGQGGTPLRAFVLGSAIIMFVLTAAVLWRANRPAPSAFVRWYAAALLLVATGLLGIMLESVHGGALSWTGRAAQFLGGAYMLVAAVASVRESGTWGVSLSAALHEFRQRYEELFALAADGIVVHELASPGAETGSFLQVNPAICRLLGYSEVELRELTPLDIMAPEDRQVVPQDMKAMARDGVLRHGKTLVTKDGRRIFTEIATRQFVQGGRPMVMSVIRDITERKLSDDALRQMNVELEHRVAEKTAELRQANESLERRVTERAGEIQKANEELESSRRAALNLMDDAIAVRQQAEQAAAELAQRAGELRAVNEDLARFNRAAVDRELRMIELKMQVSELSAKLGQPPVYGLEFEKI